MIKFIKRGLGIIAVAIAVMLPMMPQASADTGGGIGDNCTGGCPLGIKDFYWRGWTTTNTAVGKKDAYQQFKNTINSETKGKQNGAYIDNRVNNGPGRVPGGAALCQKSNYVWALTIHTSSRWGWAYSITFETHGPKWDNRGQGTIEKPWRGKAPSAELVAKVKNWDATKNGKQIDKAPGYIILCSGVVDEDIPDPAPNKWSTVSYSDVPEIDDLTVTHPYSCSTEVVPQGLVSGKDLIGKDNLHAQKSDAVKTNYGILFDKFSADLDAGRITWTIDTVKNYRKLVDQAVAKDRNVSCGKLDLDQANKEGMAEGGVLNFTERKLNARLRIYTDTKKVSKTTCDFTQTWNKSTKKWNPATSVCNTVPYSNSVYNWQSVGTPTQENTGFWQMISVHCNKEDFDSLLAAVPSATRINTGDTSGLFSNVAVSKKYDTRPSTVDFSDPSSTNSAIRNSATLGFYDKECPFNCTSNKTAPGASALNGATTNIQNAKPSGPNGKVIGTNKWGATSGNLNGNDFSFFRDNDKKPVTLDVWFPESSPLISYDGHAATSTTVNRWSKGTPEDSQFTFEDKSGNRVFGDTVLTNVEKNWETNSTYKGKYAARLAGNHRTFNTSSTWAGEKENPQTINVKWEYKPNVNTVFPAVNVGFGTPGNISLGSNVKISTPVEGKCYAQFGKSNHVTDSALIQKNTGTGTTNNLDGKLWQESGAPVNTPADDGTNLFINFIRATGE